MEKEDSVRLCTMASNPSPYTPEQQNAARELNQKLGDALRKALNDNAKNKVPTSIGV